MLRSIIAVFRDYPGIRYNLLFALLAGGAEALVGNFHSLPDIPPAVRVFLAAVIGLSILGELWAVEVLIAKVASDPALDPVRKGRFAKWMMWLVVLECAMLLLLASMEAALLGLPEKPWKFVFTVACLLRQGWFLVRLGGLAERKAASPSPAAVEGANLLLLIPMVVYTVLIWNNFVTSFENYGSFFNLLDPNEWGDILIFGGLGAVLFLLPIRFGWFLGEYRGRKGTLDKAVFAITLAVYFGAAFLPVFHVFGPEEYVRRAELRVPGTNFTRIDAALSDYKMALSFRADWPPAVEGKAELLFRAGQAKSLYWLFEVYQRGNLTPTGLVYLSEYYRSDPDVYYLGGEKLRWAETYLGYAFALSPSNAAAYASRADWALWKKDNPSAIADARAALVYADPSGFSAYRAAKILLEADPSRGSNAMRALLRAGNSHASNAFAGGEGR